MNASGRAVFFGAIGMMIVLVTVFLLYQRKQVRDRERSPVGTSAGPTHQRHVPKR